MIDQPIYYYPTLDTARVPESTSAPRLEPTTCTEAETFVLQVLDDSMEPEFRRGCMIVIDPTGRATDKCYVLARSPAGLKPDIATVSVDDFIFRQLRRTDAGGWSLQVLNPRYAAEPVPISLAEVVGVIVQRAGVRRRYHKRYD